MVKDRAIGHKRSDHATYFRSSYHQMKPVGAGIS